MKQYSRIEECLILQYLKYNNLINKLLFFDKLDCFIHPLSIPLVPFRITGCWTLSLLVLNERWSMPWISCQAITGLHREPANMKRQPTICTRAHDYGNFESPLNLNKHLFGRREETGVPDLLWCSMPIWFIFFNSVLI